MGDGVLISAHRGGSDRHPPGTWEAYATAHESGAEMAELDVRRTADGILVAHHGPEASGLAYDGLCALAGHDVPTVPALLELLAGHGLVAHLDLKEVGDEAAVVDLALAAAGARGVVVTTLEDPSVAAVRARHPEVLTALSLGRDTSDVGSLVTLRTRARELFPFRRVARTGAHWLAVHTTLARLGVLSASRRRGVPTMIWTVNDEPAMERFLTAPGVRVLITDRPRTAVAVRGTTGR